MHPSAAFIFESDRALAHASPRPMPLLPACPAVRCRPPSNRPVLCALLAGWQVTIVDCDNGVKLTRADFSTVTGVDILVTAPRCVSQHGWQW